jgi:hypothetical protein
LADIIYVELDYVVPGYTVSTLDGAVAIVTAFSMDGPANSGWAVDGYWDPGYATSGAEGTRVTVKTGAATLSSTATSSIAAAKTAVASATLASVDAFGVTAQAQKNFVADLSSTVTISATASITRGIATQPITWDQQTAGWIDFIGTTWDGNFTGLLLPAVSTFTAESKTNTDATLDAVVTATVGAGGSFTAGGQSGLTSASSISAIGDKFREGVATLVTTSTLSVNGGQSATGAAEITAQATVTAQAQPHVAPQVPLQAQ